MRWKPATLDARARNFRAGSHVVQRERVAPFKNGATLPNEVRVLGWFRDLPADLRYAFRSLRKQPGFAAAAVLSAALGTGACCTIFGLANFALLRELQVEDPARLESLSGAARGAGKVGQSLTYPDFEDLRKARSFEGVSGYFPFLPASIAGSGGVERCWGSLVTANYFSVVRPRFELGHGFDPARDDRPGEAPVIVLGHHLWRSRFGADPKIVGRSIEWSGRKVTVIGVTDARFRGAELLFYSEFWVPFSMVDSLAQAGMGGDRLHDRGGQWLGAVARLRRGVSEATAQAELATLADRLSAAYPATNKERAFHIEQAGRIHPAFRKPLVVFLSLLLVVTGLVLCTACANVANLLLARAAARRREIATRLAMGASRARLVRQLLTESLLLASLGGLGGYAVAWLSARLLGTARIPLGLPFDFTIALDHRVAFFSIALSFLTGVLFGVLPALSATRIAWAQGGLREDRITAGARHRFGSRQLLVIAQMAICMVLLLCCGLFLRSLVSARGIDTGFTHRNILLAAFDPSAAYAAPDRARRLMNDVVERTRALPGVEAVSLSSSIPLALEGTQNGFVPEGAESRDGRDPLIADIYSITPGYFETFGIRLLDGQDFRSGMKGEETAIVNQTLAEKAFPHANPVGRRILYFGKALRVIGVAANTKSRSIGEPPHLCLYLPIANNPRGNDSLTGVTLALRTRGNPERFAPAVHEIFRSLDPGLALFNVRPMEMHLSQALLLPRLEAFFFGLAAVMGLVIATVGIYGVVSYAVAGQTREIGIRMALGAQRGLILRNTLGEGVLLAASGAAIGFGVGLALTRFAASFLYGVSPRDGFTFGAVPVLLLLISTAACLSPASRAASLSPMEALRWE